MSFFEPYDLQMLRAEQRDAGDDLATIEHHAAQELDAGGAPGDVTVTTYTQVTIRRGSRTARSGPEVAFEDTQEQTAGGTRFVLPVLQPKGANAAIVDALAVGDYITIGGQRYKVTSAPPRRTTDVYRAVQAEEVR